MNFELWQVLSLFLTDQEIELVNIYNHKNAYYKGVIYNCPSEFYEYTVWRIYVQENKILISLFDKKGSE